MPGIKETKLQNKIKVKSVPIKAKWRKLNSPSDCVTKSRKNSTYWITKYWPTELLRLRALRASKIKIIKIMEWKIVKNENDLPQKDELVLIYTKLKSSGEEKYHQPDKNAGFCIVVWKWMRLQRKCP